MYDQHSDMFDFYPNLRRAITPYHAELIEQGLRLKDRDKGVKALAASENAAGSSQVVGPTVEATAAGEAMAVDNASPAGEAAPAQDATPADEATPGNGATATQQANATANVATAVVPATRRPFSRCPLGEVSLRAVSSTTRANPGDSSNLSGSPSYPATSPTKRS